MTKRKPGVIKWTLIAQRVIFQLFSLNENPLIGVNFKDPVSSENISVELKLDKKSKPVPEWDSFLIYSLIQLI